MTLIRHEWKKLFSMPALWVFVILCLLLNGLVLYNFRYDAGEFNQMSALAQELGQRVDADFIVALEARERTELEDEALTAAKALTNIFDGFVPTNYADVYHKLLDGHTLLLELLQRKYERAAVRSAHLAETGVALDFYAGPATLTAFGIQCAYLQFIIIEGAVLGVLSMLFLWGYEGLQHTAGMVCASRTGRRLYRKKVLAGAIGALMIYALISSISLMAYLLVWDYRGVWDASMSSAFMSRTDPFLTWADFSVAGYLASSVALGGMLAVVFALLAAACVGLVGNTFAAALLTALLCFLGFDLPLFCRSHQLWEGFFLTYLQPVWMIWDLKYWFTEYGSVAAIPWFETVGTAASLAVTAAASVLALRRFYRKDVRV